MFSERPPQTVPASSSEAFVIALAGETILDRWEFPIGKPQSSDKTRFTGQCGWLMTLLIRTMRVT